MDRPSSGREKQSSTAAQLVGSGIKTCWRFLDRVACLAGRGIATATGLAASSIRHIVPTCGQALVTAHADAVDVVNAMYVQAAQRVSALGQQVEELAHNSLVKTTATRAAATASGLLVLHLVTKGLLASKALEVAPPLAGMVVALTSPWWLLTAVMGITVSTIAAVAYLKAGRDELPQDLVVNVAADGSVTITGIPSTMSKAERESTSAQAMDQALSQLAKGATVRPTRRTCARHITRATNIR